MNKVTVNVKLCCALLGWSLLLPLLYSCSAPMVLSPPIEEVRSSEDYALLGSEDNVEVQVWKNPDLSRTVTIRPDGKISLPLIGDVQAAGLTAAQLTEAVTEKLRAYYKDPAQVTVIVNPVNSYIIYMLGEGIRGQGKQVVRSGTTLLQAISLAGGFTPFASTSKIALRRRGSNGKESFIILNYKDILAGRQDNPDLKAGDTIIVP